MSNRNNAIEDAWLDINVDESKLINPFDFETEEEFHLKLTWLLMQPEYFCFICKHIFNVEILPVQALMIKEMWHRKFPMLIASRGFGKSFVLSLYAMMRALLMPNRKIVIVLFFMKFYKKSVTQKCNHYFRRP